MHAEDQIAAERAGEVVGVWHSHTDEDNQASEADMSGVKHQSCRGLLSTSAKITILKLMQSIVLVM
jgi:proteasome lid subunit RPN8/RPN11